MSQSIYDLFSLYKYEVWYIAWSSNKFENRFFAYKYEHRKHANEWHLILIDTNFAAAKEKAIINVKIIIKSWNNLDSNFSLKFNDTFIERQENDIYLKQIFQFNHL
jgi:hypothetical protein